MITMQPKWSLLSLDEKLEAIDRSRAIRTDLKIKSRQKSKPVTRKPAASRRKLKHPSFIMDAKKLEIFNQMSEDCKKLFM